MPSARSSARASSSAPGPASRRRPRAKRRETSTSASAPRGPASTSAPASRKRLRPPMPGRRSGWRSGRDRASPTAPSRQAAEPYRASCRQVGHGAIECRVRETGVLLPRGSSGTSRAWRSCPTKSRNPRRARPRPRSPGTPLGATRADHRRIGYRGGRRDLALRTVIGAKEVCQLIRHAERRRDEDQAPAEDRAEDQREQVREPGDVG